MFEMVFEFIMEITGETNASGLRVGSEEYSKPGFSILTSSSLLIVVESGSKVALVPWVDAILTNDGKSSYPTPPKLRLTLSTGPFALIDFVEYFNVLVSVDPYDNFSGISGIEMLNVVYEAPTTEGTLKILYSPLYLLSR